MVSALIMMNHKGWTFEELFNRMDFDILTRTAFGLSDINDDTVCPATIFNFQNKISKYFSENKVNLIEKTFDNLTKEQIKALGIKTNIQRSDSTLIASNIRNYSRLQLLVEVLLRLFRILNDADKKQFSDELKRYLKYESSEQYIYHLRGIDLPHELEAIGQIYSKLYACFKETYKETETFQTFKRVFFEHFKLDEDKINVIPSKELGSGIVQSPDDLDATYRKKGDDKSHGTIINVVETCHPDNELNLITDLVVKPNNVDDSEILNERIDKILEKTPDLAELHTDGGYGSEGNDKRFDELNITHIQTAIRGRESKVKLDIAEISDEKYLISCPFQSVESTKSKTRFKANFIYQICKDCPHVNDCPTKQHKKYRVYYFKHEDYLKNRRHKSIELLPKERRKLRANVEATMKEFKNKIPDGKLKVRGLYKTIIFAFTKAMSINFGRIYRNNAKKC